MRAGVAGDEALVQLRELVAAQGGELAAALVRAWGNAGQGPRGAKPE